MWQKYSQACHLQTSATHTRKVSFHCNFRHPHASSACLFFCEVLKHIKGFLTQARDLRCVVLCTTMDGDVCVLSYCLVCSCWEGRRPLYLNSREGGGGKERSHSWNKGALVLLVGLCRSEKRIFTAGSKKMKGLTALDGGCFADWRLQVLSVTQTTASGLTLCCPHKLETKLFPFPVAVKGF